MPKLEKKNIKLVLSVLCSGVTIDQQSNNASLYNIIEAITIPKDKLQKIETNNDKNMLGVPVSFNLFSVWHRTKKAGLLTAEVKVQISDPSGKTRDIGSEPIQLAEKVQSLRLTMRWAGIKVTSSGIYTFKILKKEKGEKNFSGVGEIYLKMNITEKAKSVKSEKPKKSKN